MQYQSLILVFAVIYCNKSRCQKFPLESVRRSYPGNISQNICPKSEKEFLYSHLPGKGFKGSENEMVELIKRKFLSMAGNRIKSNLRKDEVQDDPNLIQALMSRAFIDNANYVFHKNEIKDEESGAYLIGKHIFQVPKYPKVKTDLDKSFRCSSSRGKRNILDKGSKLDEESDDNDYENRERLKHCKLEESEMRVHCVRAGPSEVICKHENYSFSFKLPADLFDKKIMENLVSSVCSIVEEASPDGGGKVEISVRRTGKNLKKDGEYDGDDDSTSSKTGLKEHKDDTERVINKVIRINIPIDFSAIPLGLEEDDKQQGERSNKEFPHESKRTVDSDSLALSDTPTEQLMKKSKFQQTQNEDGYELNKDQNADSLIQMYPNDYNGDNFCKDQNQEKWLSKRDNLHNPMVFPPSLILVKRSPPKHCSDEVLNQEKKDLKEVV